MVLSDSYEIEHFMPTPISTVQRKSRHLVTENETNWKWETFSPKIRIILDLYNNF